MESSSKLGYQDTPRKKSFHGKSKRKLRSGQEASDGHWNAISSAGGNTNVTSVASSNIADKVWRSSYTADEEGVEAPHGGDHCAQVPDAASADHNGITFSQLYEVSAAGMYVPVDSNGDSLHIAEEVGGFSNPESIWHPLLAAYHVPTYHDGVPAPQFHMQHMIGPNHRPFERITHELGPFEAGWHQSSVNLVNSANHVHSVAAPSSGGSHVTEAAEELVPNSDRPTAVHSKKATMPLPQTESERTKVLDLSPGPEATPKSSEGGRGVVSPYEDDQHLQEPQYANPVPKADGKYHCPFAEEQDCGHAPTRHRCYYEKYLDSHFKPYRCKARGCEDLRFSSSACRVRHEREAHGSHGHGLKPFLCEYPDCDRAKEGNGFPRLWNRNDHMKRVHDHPQNPSCQSQAGEEDLGTNVRKRQALEAATDGAVKRVKLPTEKQAHTEKLAQLARDWVTLHTQLHETWHNIRGPLDLANVEKLHAESGQLLSSAYKIYKGVNRVTEESNARRSQSPRL